MDTDSLDRLTIALKIEELTRQLEAYRAQSDGIIAELLLSVQAYVDAQGGYER